MSDTKSPDRDKSGRFLKPEAEYISPGEEGTHPLATLLFGWVSSPRTPGLILGGVVAACVALVVTDYAMHRDEYVDMANFNGFFGFWGFGAFALAVLSGWPLGHLLRRGEDYYGEGPSEPRRDEGEADQ